MTEFKLIVAGGRDFDNAGLLNNEIKNLANTIYNDQAVSIVSGMANGADRMGYTFALRNGVVVHKFPADWDKYGKSAGMIRNKQMGDFADGLLAFWDGKSRGTAQMIQYMRSLNKPVYIVSY